MPVHQLEHELSGKYPEVAHGAGLSALFCSWARYVCGDDPMRFAQLAVRVWDVEMNFENPLKTALDGIQRMEDYFKSLNMPVRLTDLEADVKEEDFDEMAEKCTNFGRRVLPGIRELGKHEMMDIYRMAL